MLGARQEHVHAVLEAQEADVAAFVASHQRDEQDCVLLALVVIDRGHFHAGCVLCILALVALWWWRRRWRWRLG